MSEIVALTSIRGIAALWVLWFHFGWALSERQVGTVLPFGPGWLAVDLFFVLSGFILTLTHPRLTPADSGPFLWKRFARVYPLHLFALVLLLGLVGFALLAKPSTNLSAYPMRDFFLSLVMAQYAFGTPGTWNFPSWSVQVEAVLYCTLPFVIPAIARLPRTALLVAFVVLAALVVVLPVEPGIVHPAGSYARAFLEMSLGSVTYRLYMGRAARQPLLWTALGATIAAVAAGMPIASVPFLAILVGELWKDRGPVARALGGRIPHVLGEISYSIYLLHIPVLLTLNAVVPISAWTHGTGGQVAYAALFVMLTLTAATLSYRFVERPARTWLVTGSGAIFRRPPRSATVPAAGLTGDPIP